MANLIIKHMVDRFLGWGLPLDFNPDNGILFQPNAHQHWPTGTNLFDATQAEGMVAHMIEGLAMPSDIRTDEDLTNHLVAAAEVDPVIQFFGFAHLPPHLRAISRPFAEQAIRMLETLPRNPERTVAFRKLIEAKDCAVRSLIWKG